jgi:hypothetical protein
MIVSRSLKIPMESTAQLGCLCFAWVFVGLEEPYETASASPLIDFDSEYDKGTRDMGQLIVFDGWHWLYIRR